MPLLPAQLLNNRYRIVKLLGQGGFGAVYRAWDINLETARAVKENLDTSTEAQRQFKREAQILDKLSHPNLPKVIDHFVLPGQGQYLVMEFVDGEDLGSKLQKAGGPLPEADVLEWIRQVSDALIYLHSQNPTVIHRDIKPANIRITPAGKALLVDFGIAKVFDSQIQTTVGARAVTPGYSPIEQYGKGQHTDARTDIYAIGATLYALLAGQEPIESVQRLRNDPQLSVDKINPAISSQTTGVLNKAMQVFADQRFQSAAELKAALGAEPQPPVNKTMVVPLLSGSSTGINATSPRMKSFSLSWLVGGALAMLLLLVVVIGSISAMITVMNKRHIPPEDASAGEIWISPEDGAALAYIPGGEFMMGSTEDGHPNEKPQHRIFLSSYWIDRTEVTNAMFEQFIQDTGYRKDVEQVGYAWTGSDWEQVNGTDWQHPQGPGSDLQGLEQHPVVQVSWNDASAYCAWAGRRLPTEAEWEKAARGTSGRMYPWGDAPVAANLLNFADESLVADWADKNANDGYQFTAPVGSYQAGVSPYGLLDMAGNVWEWVLDWFDEGYYANSPGANPFGPETGQYRVFRGGGWGSDGPYVRTAFRYNLATASDHFDDVGFRCLLPSESEIGASAELTIQAQTVTDTPSLPASYTPPATATPKPSDTPVPTQTSTPDIPMVLIPASEFQMGNDDYDSWAACEKVRKEPCERSEFLNEEPVHTVYLDAFYIDIYEVTNARYAECVMGGACDPPSDFKSYSRDSYYSNLEYLDYPVIYVDWSKAQAYCKWRGGSLPTEAQWEKAARGGLEEALYPWGDDPPVCQKSATNGAKLADFVDCWATDTEQVGSYNPNGYGLYDMAGNVWEWVIDWYLNTFYSSSPFENPIGPAAGSYRVFRGGGWLSYDHDDLRVANREASSPTGNHSVGFRCIRLQNVLPSPSPSP